jgi:elongation factor P hydroxylase
MSKEPKIDHEYHAGKDKLKITVKGYALSKKARDEILQKFIADVERKPDWLTAVAKKTSKKKEGKKPRGYQKTSKLVEVGD